MKIKRSRPNKFKVNNVSRRVRTTTAQRKLGKPLEKILLSTDTQIFIGTTKHSFDAARQCSEYIEEKLTRQRAKQKAKRDERAKRGEHVKLA